jgi:hypothetical protein
VGQENRRGGNFRLGRFHEFVIQLCLSFNCVCHSIVIAERIVHHDRCAVLAKSCIPADMITMVMDIDQMKP